VLSAFFESIRSSINSHPEVLVGAIGSGIGGFVGVILFFTARVIWAKIFARTKVLRRYFCVTSTNSGGLDEIKGELEHRRGQATTGSDAQRRWRVGHDIWTISNTPPKPAKMGCIYFGPYTMDPGDPGHYSVRYRIKGFGFQRPAEIQNDWHILELDVLRTQTIHGPISTAAGVVVGKIDTTEVIARRTVRVSDLAKRSYWKFWQRGWNRFDLPFYSDGKGVWEYRCFAFDGEGDRPDFLSKCDAGVEIGFDFAEVRSRTKYSLPWD
jgi:hypothetical protein